MAVKLGKGKFVIVLAVQSVSLGRDLNNEVLQLGELPSLLICAALLCIATQASAVHTTLVGQYLVRVPIMVRIGTLLAARDSINANEQCIVAYTHNTEYDRNPVRPPEPELSKPLIGRQA